MFLAHGVTVALQVLVLSVEVRILMGQQVKAQEYKAQGGSNLCLVFVPWIFITALWYNGSTSDSGSECQGSNPCRATMWFDFQAVNEGGWPIGDSPFLFQEL